MSIAMRVSARAIYSRWFYAPHLSGRRCVERLRALGFLWDGQQWHLPSRERFLEGIRQ